MNNKLETKQDIKNINSLPHEVKIPSYWQCTNLFLNNCVYWDRPYLFMSGFFPITTKQKNIINKQMTFPDWKEPLRHQRNGMMVMYELDQFT